MVNQALLMLKKLYIASDRQMFFDKLKNAREKSKSIIRPYGEYKKRG